MLVVVLLILLRLLVAATTTIAAAVIPLSSGATQTGFLHNVTKAPILGAIDPRFTTEFEQGQARLSAASCYMNAVNAMMELALENFTEPIRPRNFMDPSYPEVAIVLMSPARGLMVEARYLLWGIWEGITWMISHRSFRDLVIATYWDGIPICRIWIRGTQRQLSTARSNSTLSITTRSGKISLHNATVDSTQGLKMMGARNPSNDQHLIVSVTHIGGVLGIAEVFIPIFAALEYMAHFSGTDEVVSFDISPDDEDTTIGIVEHPWPRPPLLQYQWAILSLGQIPEYMVRQRRFIEVDFEINVDGVPLGEGFLSK